MSCQEPSRETLLTTLRITVEEALETNRADAGSAASENFEENRNRSMRRRALERWLNARAVNSIGGWPTLLVYPNQA